jgi:tetratricopeptide (TPR) repeat protein
MEGREDPQLFLGMLYHFRGPKYFFPAMIAVKVPIGLFVLLLLGIFLFLSGRIPSAWKFPSGIVLAVAILFLLVLANGATYAGIRHALPVVLLLSIFAGISFAMALSAKTQLLKVLVTLAFVAAALSALPQLRPWEYFNEFVGGSTKAYAYFSDEGVGLGQRTKELTNYYNRELKPKGLRPDCIYDDSEEEEKARGINCFGSDKDNDPPLIALPERSGTIIVTRRRLFRNSYWDRAALREATPVALLGELSIYRGTFYLPGQAASALYWYGIDKIYGDKPDEALAEKYFRQSLELDPKAYFVYIQVGNLYLKRGSREECFQAYSNALKYAPDESELRSALQNQIQRVSREPLVGISPLRDPYME